MMGKQQLIVAVEGTAAVGPFWKTILSDYLHKIIRCFCANEPASQKQSTTNVELSLVMFNAHGSYSACLVQRTGWTRDMDIFFQWLQAIPFGGGGFNDAAIAEGLAEALMMFTSPNGNQNQNVEGQRHCILVAASNPYPLPTPVYRPQPQNLEKNESIETQPDNRLSDAETLAKSFAQCAVSLSVICPKQLPKLRGIYNAAKRNPRAADPPVDNVKNPHFLVLISENFMEARASLSRFGMADLPSSQPVKADVAPVPPISGPDPATVASTNVSVLLRQPVPVGNMPPATVKVEPTAVTGPAFPHMPSVPRPTSQPVPSLQTSSPLSTSQEVVTNNENVPETKPLVNNVPPPSRFATRILNDVAQVRGRPVMGGTPMLSNMISSGMTSSIPPAQNVMSSGPSGPTSISGSLPISMPTSQVVQNPSPAPFNSTTSNASGNSNLGMSQPLNNNNVLVNVSLGQAPISQGNLPVATQTAAVQMVPTGMNSMTQNMISVSGDPSASGTGSMMPTPGMSQQPTIQQPVGVNGNNVVANMPLNQPTSSTMQTAQSKYVKVWEGNLSGQRQGQPVFITRLEGYRSASASETLAANWPPVMQIVRLISQDHMNNKQYVGKADFLVFRAMNQHGFLGQLQEKKLCAVIQLPSQTLLLSVSDKAHRLIGMLFPGDMVVFKPQIPNQQQQLQAQIHQQQQQQQQQQLQQQNLQQLQQPQQSLQQMQQQHQPLQQMQQQQQQPQQPQQPVPQMQQLQQQQQQPLMHIQQQQQIPQMQQPQQQQMVGGTGMNQAYMQGAPGRSQLLSQGQASSQGAPSMSGGSFMG